MRVIAGQAKGQKLAPVPGDTTRPIMDRVKENLFNILGPEIQGARFMDLFAGTGGVGIEALSRGAAQATFVEKEYRAFRVIQANLKSTGLASKARVIKADVFKFLADCAERADVEPRYDVIYVAPPQYQGLWARTVHMLDEQNLLTPGGSVIVQIFPKEYEELELAHLAPYDQRKYGSTLLVFYGWSEHPVEDASTQSQG